MSNDSVPESLARLQRDFAAHIRDPRSCPAPEGIEDRRMAIYRNLFFSNIKSFLSANFPVLKSLYEESAWNILCRDFYREHRCHTPLFPELPREFLQYLQETRSDASDPPFMLELAHYEWVELALSLDESDFESSGIDPDADLLTGCPVLSPLAWPLSYRFPVHRISSDYQPATAPEEPTHLLVWRRRDFVIRFMQMNDVTRLLLETMHQNPGRTGLELLNSTAESIRHPRPEAVVQNGATLLADLLEKQVIVGARDPLAPTN